MTAPPSSSPRPVPGATLLAARRAQGLPDEITDPVVLERLARALLPAARRAAAAAADQPEPPGSA